MPRFLRRFRNHLTGLLRFCLDLATLSREEQREVLICLTVDGDAGGNPHAIEKASPLLLEIYDQFNLPGKVSWFINNQDEWITHYPHLLEDILRRGDRIELHCHIEDLIRKDAYEQLLRHLKREKETLEQFCGRFVPDYRIECFRSGRFDRSEKMFAALEEIGIRYDSSLTHGSSFVINGKKIDDRDISPSANCYFLKPDFYKTAQQDQTQIIQIPVWEPFPNMKELMRSGDGPIVITNLIHPFNMVTKRGSSNLLVEKYYQWIISLLQKIPRARFCTLLEAGNAWREVHG